MAQDPPRNTALPLLALGCGVLCIGLSAIFVKIAGVPGPVSAFYRILVAAFVIVPFWLYRNAQPPTRSDILLTLAGGILFGLDLALWNTSLMLTSAANATVLANNAPLWVALWSFIIVRERLSSRYWLGLTFALAGMTIIVGVDAWNRIPLNSGNLLALGASGVYAAYLLTTQEVRSRVDTLTFTAISTLSGLLVLLVLNLVLGSPMTGYTTRSWTALIALGVITHAGGWLTINYALGHLRAAPVAVTLLGQVVVTAILAVPLLDETVSPYQVVGGLLILIGIHFAHRRMVTHRSRVGARSWVNCTGSTKWTPGQSHEGTP